MTSVEYWVRMATSCRRAESLTRRAYAPPNETVNEKLAPARRYFPKRLRVW